MAQTLEDLSAQSRRSFAIGLVELLRSYQSDIHPITSGDFDFDRALARWHVLLALEDNDTLRRVLVGTQEIGSEPSAEKLKSTMAQLSPENAEVAALLVHSLTDRFEEYLDQDMAVITAEWLLLINEYCGDYACFAPVGTLLRGIARYADSGRDAKNDFSEAARLGHDIGLAAPIRVGAFCALARCESDGGRHRWSNAAAAIDLAADLAGSDKELQAYIEKLRAWLLRRRDLLKGLDPDRGADAPEAAFDAVGDIAALDLFTPLWRDAIWAAVNERAAEAVALCRTLDALGRRLNCGSSHCRSLGLVAELSSAWAVGEALLRAAHEDGVDDEETLIMLARTLQHQGKSREAVDFLTNATETFPRSSDAWRDLGLCLIDLEEDDKARRALSRALEISPRDALAGMALAHLRPAGSTQPVEESALGRAKRLFQTRRYAEAKNAFSTAIVENPHDAYAYMALGDCHYMLGDFYLAAAHFEESIAIQPLPSTWRFLGDAYRKVCRSEKAKAAYESAIALDPSYDIARQQLEAMREAEQRT